MPIFSNANNRSHRSLPCYELLVLSVSLYLLPFTTLPAIQPHVYIRPDISNKRKCARSAAHYVGVTGFTDSFFNGLCLHSRSLLTLPFFNNHLLHALILQETTMLDVSLQRAAKKSSTFERLREQIRHHDFDALDERCLWLPNDQLCASVNLTNRSCLYTGTKWSLIYFKCLHFPF